MKKTNNKGFSLIELIIVIAIMAILVAIIAPNLTKYLGKSKKSTDKKNADEIASQLQTSITDFESQDNSGKVTANAGADKKITIKWTGNTAAIDPATESPADPGQSDTQTFIEIVNSNITSSTKSKETNNEATATIEEVSGGKYKITVTVGNASVTK